MVMAESPRQTKVNCKLESFRILILGGYGNFGARIARRLAADARMRLWIAGRDRAKAEALCRNLGSTPDRAAQALQLDLADPAWRQTLDVIRPHLVIHTCGPFQGSTADVAQAAIARGCHYIDLADSREFVLGFNTLDAAAREHNVLAVTGASTVPGLSAAVIDRFRGDFAILDAIECGISPGNRTERGLATVAAILSYSGKPIPRWHDGRWQDTFGWQDLHRHRFPNPVGARWLSACDVPDIGLFPDRYGLRDLRVAAGLELSFLHLGLWSLSWLARAGLVADWARYSRPLARISEWFDKLGSDAGAMFVRLRGRDHEGKELTRTWSILATSGDGPQIPCTAAVLLARKLASGDLPERGARPCLDLFSLDEFLAEMADYNIRTMIE